MFRPLRSRDDLLALVKAHAPTKACASAIEEGRAIVLGGFGDTEYPFYLIDATAERGQHYRIRVEVYENQRKYKIEREYIQEIPWHMWHGTTDGKRPLIDGDQHKPEWKELYAQRTPQKASAP